MLRRNSSSRLDRCKSTSSAHSKHASIDPEVAHQHAQAAATLAFARAQERYSADMGHRGGGLSRSNTTSRHQDQQQLAQTGQAPPNVIRRQQSVRFVGPSSVQKHQSVGTRAVNNPAIPKPSPASLRPMAMTTNDPVPAAYRPPSRSSSIGKASTGKATADSYVTAIAAYNEYYTQEDDVASTPSSYRRIRRSKSMFSPLKAPNVFYTNGTPEKSVGGYRIGEQSIVYPPAGTLRAPKSMSFLRGGHEHLTPSLRDRNDESVQLARDRFFHQASQQRLREQPSFLFRSKAQRQEKPFRQSVRTSSTNSYGLPIASNNQLEPRNKYRLKEKARRASKSIKNKLRRAFGRSKDEPVQILNQQVDAHETHVRGYPGDSTLVDNAFDSTPHSNRTTFHRVASRPPSIHLANSSQQLRSYAGSIKSTKSDHSDDKSRVTSWNSTGVNTIASQAFRLQSERDLQRLSIINENGTHVPSLSSNRQKLSNQFSSYPVIHRPSKSLGHVPAPPPGPVDSARVYSALMKRLDENSPKAKLEAARKASLESLNAPKCVPPRSSSIHGSHGNRTPATIRQVTESRHSSEGEGSTGREHRWVKANSLNSTRDEDIFGHTGTHIHQCASADALRDPRMRDQDDVFSPKHIYNDKENLSIDHQRARSGSIATQEASIRTSYHTVPENLGLTPQELASRNEPLVRKPKVVRETKSIFFGGSSCTISRTTSPFRRALADGDYTSTSFNSSNFTPLEDFPLPNPLYIIPKSATQVDGHSQIEDEKAYSESVYSRTTSGQVPRAANSALSLPIADDDTPEIPPHNTSNGDIVILDRATYRPAIPGSASHRTTTTSTGSIEWKKWMSSEVAKLERTRENTNSAGSYVNYALPTMPKLFRLGHVRESAQINEDDTSIGQRSVGAIKQPLGIIQQNASIQNIQQTGLLNPQMLKPILKNRSTLSLIENIDSNIINQSFIPIPPPPPPIPIRSPLRAVQSKSSLRSVNTVATLNTARTQSAPNSTVKIASINGRDMLHKRNISQTTVRSTKSLDTPAKLVKRNGRKMPHRANTPSPGGRLGATGNKQFCSMSTSTRSRTPDVKRSTNRENCSSPEEDDIYDADGAGLVGPVMSGRAQRLDAQQMGSKRMVDLFLSSRRRRIAGASEDESGAVFI